MDEVNSFLNGTNWVISLIGALVLSILGNLLTSPVKNYLGRLSGKRATKRIDQLNAELERIEGFVNSPPSLTLFVLGIGTRIVFVTLVAFAISDITAASVNLAIYSTRFGGTVELLLWGLSQFVTSLLYLIGVNYALRLRRTISQVQDFENYKDDTNKTIDLLAKTAVESTNETTDGG